MREFVIGRRRKIGVATLLVASVLGMFWVRSQSTCDWIAICPSGQAIYNVASDENGICVRKLYDPPPIHLPVFWWGSTEIPPLNTLPILDPVNGALDEEIVLCPYWCIVLPLSFISAWCLLTKPRTKPDAKPETSDA
jgi:hypothetical protein